MSIEYQTQKVTSMTQDGDIMLSIVTLSRVKGPMIFASFNQMNAVFADKDTLLTEETFEHKNRKPGNITLAIKKNGLLNE